MPCLPLGTGRFFLNKKAQSLFWPTALLKGSLYLYVTQIWHYREFNDTMCLFSPTMLSWLILKCDPLQDAAKQSNKEVDYVRETSSSSC